MAQPITSMKSLIVILSSFVFCSCANMFVTSSTVGGSGVTAPTDTKDFASNGIHMVTSCGVGAYAPKAIYIRPFCIDTASFRGDQTDSAGEMPIRKALTPVQFAGRAIGSSGLRSGFALPPSRTADQNIKPMAGLY